MGEGRVAYMGGPGAFGEQACRAFVPGLMPLARDSFGSVVDAVRAGDARNGLIPFENRIAGRVPGAEAALAQAGIRIIDRRWLPVSLHLAGLPGACAEDIDLVASHEVALSQCSGLLARLGVATRACASTSLAAREVRSAGNPRHAALASEAAARLHGLSILISEVQDRQDNATCFAIIAAVR